MFDGRNLYVDVEVSFNEIMQKGGAKKGKDSGPDADIKAEQRRIIDEIHKAPDIGEYPMDLEMA